MKSIILCEGSTDYVLLQYFMRNVYEWKDIGKTNEKSANQYIKRIRTLVKEECELSIGACGGSNRILPGFNYVLEINSISVKTESYNKIVILTDRDEITTEVEFCNEIERILNINNVQVNETICNDKWIKGNYKNGQGKTCEVEILLLVVPFEETGAMETFLLNAISENDDYDAEIINECNLFVDNIDREKRYLSKRRYITKAKFDVYFSVRTAAEQFVER